MKDFLLVGIGGWFGAASRYYMGLWIAKRLGTGFPYATLSVNLIGCLVLGFLWGLSLDRGIPFGRDFQVIVAVGFLGAFTTFSAFGYETIRLLEDRAFGGASLYIVSSVFIGLLAVYLGIRLGKVLS